MRSNLAWLVLSSWQRSLVLLARGGIALLIAVVSLPSMGAWASDGATSARRIGGTWTMTGKLTTPRSDHSAARLADGRVLVVGPDTTAEVYDPASGRWSATGSMRAARRFANAVTLQDGRVLVVGGGGGEHTADLYDPVSGTFSKAGVLQHSRLYFALALLPNGQVLIAGGVSAGTYLKSAELYDPTAGTFTLTGPMNHPRSYFELTVLADGMVLAEGGVGSSGTSELYDPSAGTWMDTSPLNEFVAYPRACRLADGEAVLVGGDATGTHTELFDPETKTWRFGAAALFAFVAYVLCLQQGDALAVSSYGQTALYDPASDSWRPTHSMHIGSAAGTATLLLNDSVLVAGGDAPGKTLRRTEIFSLRT